MRGFPDATVQQARRMIQLYRQTESKDHAVTALVQNIKLFPPEDRQQLLAVLPDDIKAAIGVVAVEGTKGVRG